MLDGCRTKMGVPSALACTTLPFDGIEYDIIVGNACLSIGRRSCGSSFDVIMAVVV